MRKLIRNSMIIFLKLYKVIVSNYLLGVLGVGCRYKKTCSEFAIDAINERGIIEGTKISFRRFLSCQPFSKKCYSSLSDINNI